MRGKGDWLMGEMNNWKLVDERTEFMACCCADRENKEAIVAGKLMAANAYHEQWIALSKRPQHVRIKSVIKGIKRVCVEAGNQVRVTKPLTWEVIRVVEESLGD